MPWARVFGQDEQVTQSEQIRYNGNSTEILRVLAVLSSTEPEPESSKLEQLLSFANTVAKNKANTVMRVKQKRKKNWILTRLGSRTPYLKPVLPLKFVLKEPINFFFVYIHLGLVFCQKYSVSEII